MRIVRATLPDVLIIEPAVYRDDRGHFYESYNERAFTEAIGDLSFVQDNCSRSRRHVLRGLHYQIREPQGKLVRVTAGEIFDVAVDLRKSSPTFGGWTAHVLTAESNETVWIPPGFAHGFLVLSDFADVAYKTTTYWAPQHERCILWNDPDIAIAWPGVQEPVLSARDREGVLLAHAESYE